MRGRIRRAAAVLLAVIFLAVIFFRIGYATASRPTAPWPDIDNYDSATLMNIADGLREEMSNLQDRLERVTDLMWERLAEEKGITKGG